jgi:ribonucleoside-triphosphate reductase (formate)
MKQLNNDNAANRTSYVGYVYNIGEKTYKDKILDSLPKKWADLHRNGSIHIHDLDAYDLTYNCLTLDIINQFPYEEYQGLSEQGKLIHLFDFIKDLFTKLGNEQSGGMAFANFDNEIAEIISNLQIDYLKYQELISDLLSELILWCNNNHSRMGQTSYYVTFNIGLAKNEAARFIAHKLLDNFENLGDMVFKPNIVFKVCDGINVKPSDPNFDIFEKALKCTSKKMIPTYLLCDCKSDKDCNPEKLSIMGCRTRVVDDLYGEKGAIGRGNISNISINLPRLALEVDKESRNLSVDDKMDLLIKKWDDIAIITKDILLDRYKKVCNRSIDDFPTNNSYHLWCENFKNKKNLEEIFKHGTLSIGFIGLSEAIEVITGKKYYLDMNNYILTLGFVKHMRDYCDFLRNEYKLNFSLLATSGELISGRFIDFDKNKYKPVVDIFSKGFYTNSFHIDVDSGIPGYKKIQIEGLFHEICNGGCITYIELGEAPLGNEESLREYINIAVKSGVHYLGFNFPKDICNKCGMTGVFDICPKCNGKSITRIRRVSGYLEILDGFTNGKKAEEKHRKEN